MIVSIPTPRLLPVTITALTALLVLKCSVLLVTVVTHGQKPDSAMVASAIASEHGGEKHGSEKHGGGGEHGKEAPKAKAGSMPPAAAGGTPGQAQAGEAAPVVPAGPPPVSESEKALLQELRQRRTELDAKADAIATRESVLAAAEQKLSARVSELQALQKRLEGLDAAQKQKEDSGWQGLVKMYEAMKPKDAATIFNELSMPVLLQVLDRMKDAKAASIMAAMSPEKARDVTAELAQKRTGYDPMAAAGLKNNTMTN